MAKKGGKGAGPTIVIKRVEEVVGGHHGGAWKVAYADFVTAMMAFFLLMWLLNATTEQQRRGIAAYFSPMANVENGFSGAGLIPGGISPLDKGTSVVNKGTGSPPTPSAAPAPVLQSAAGQVTSDDDAVPAAPDSDDDDQPTGTAKTQSQITGQDAAGLKVSDQDATGQGVLGKGASGKAAAADRADGASAAARNAAAAAAEDASLKRAAEQMRRLVAADPSLTDVAGQLAIDMTPEGLRIQIMDSEKQPMFDRGAATLNTRATALLRKVAPFLATLPEPVSIDGYTDAAPWPAGSVSNWTLSSGRANAAQELLTGAGLPDSRVVEVTGFADRHLLLPADPLASANRRIVLTLRRQHAAPTPAGG